MSKDTFYTVFTPFLRPLWNLGVWRSVPGVGFRNPDTYAVPNPSWQRYQIEVLRNMQNSALLIPEKDSPVLGTEDLPPPLPNPK
eukprot:3839806-Amphidinium_carterae.1